MDIKKEYEKHAKKYSLPVWEKINKEFELSDIEDGEFLLRKIRTKITEKIEIYMHVLEGVLKPEVSLCDLYECKVFEDAEKEAIMDCYRILMFFNRYSIETAIDEDDAKTSKFIKDLWQKWPELKKQLSTFMRRLKESWLKDTDVKTELGYLG